MSHYDVTPQYHSEDTVLGSHRSNFVLLSRVGIKLLGLIGMSRLPLIIGLTD